MTTPTNNPADSRAIRLEVDVPGTPEEVWEAIASGPGISSWFVPAKVEGGVGGTITLHFGPGMDERGPITVWDPPHRFVYLEEGGRKLGYEFVVETRAGGTCLVRLVNTGFGFGDDWDSEYDSMHGGWKLFLANLVLTRTHFPGQSCSSILVNSMVRGTVADTWTRLAGSLGLPVGTVGARVAASSDDVPPLAGTVVRQTDGTMTILLDQPAPGTAFLVAEPWKDQVVTGLYVYLFGDDAAAVIARDEPAWRDWMACTFPSADASPPVETSAAP